MSIRKSDEEAGPSNPKRIKLDPNLVEIEANSIELPEEVWMMIFGSMDVQSKKQMFLVNRFLNGIMQHPSLSLDLNYDFTKDEITEDSKVFKIFMKSERPIYSLTVSFEDLPYFDARNDQQKKKCAMFEKFYRKIAQNVRILKIAKPEMDRHNFNSVAMKSLKNFKSIEKLIVDNTDVLHYLNKAPHTLTHIHINTVIRSLSLSPNFFGCLPNLKNLTVDQIFVERNWFFETEIFKEPIINIKLSSGIINFCAKNKNSKLVPKSHINLLTPDLFLDFKDVYLNLAISTLSLNSEMINESTDASLIKEARTRSTYCWFTHSTDEIELTNLEAMEINHYKGLNEYCKTCLECFIQSTPNLKKLKLKANSTTHFDPIFKYEKSFTEIEIISFRVPIKPLKFFEKVSSSFGNKFETLKVLELNDVTVDNTREWNNWPELPNLQELQINIYFKGKDVKANPKDVFNAVEGIENIAKKCRQIRNFKLWGYHHKLSCTQLKVFLENFPFLREFQTDGIDHKHKFDGYNDKAKNHKVFTACHVLEGLNTNSIKYH